MKKVLVAYFSLSGNTEKMAKYIAQGIRSGKQEVELKKITEIKNANDLNGYDAYIFGSPTYHRDMAEPMKTFLFLANKADLKGKMAAAFGSYTHTGDATGFILDTMQYVYQMDPFEINSLKLKDAVLETIEGMVACQEFGKAFGEGLGV